MPLAGRMKLNTFLLIAGGVGGAALVGGAWALSGGDDAPPPAIEVTEARRAEPVVTTPPPVATTTPSAAPAVTAPTVTAPATAREVDAVALSYVGKDIGTDKLKDVTKGKPYKVNVYQDAGKPTVNRVKLDLDRDDKWDEKLTFADGTVTREVAPNDDEAYSQRYRWDGKDWIAE